MTSAETMRLAVLSDVHGNLIALEAALADLEVQGGADLAWFLGDFVFGPRPLECIQRIKALAEDGHQRFKVIGGNVDRDLVTGSFWASAPAKDPDELRHLIESWRLTRSLLDWSLSQIGWSEYEYLTQTLGQELSEAIDGYGTVIGYHAVPGDDLAMLTPDTPDEEAADYLLGRECRLGIGGHTHLQMDRSVGHWQLVNVGSIGLSKDRPGFAQYGLFTFKNGQVDVDLRNVPYDIDAVIADAYQVGHPAPQWIEQRLRGNLPLPESK